MKYLKPLFVFVLGTIVLLITQSFQQLSLINLLTQLTLFALVVCWPIWKTGSMSYVDIGWPWGLFCIGVLTALLSEGYVWRVRAVAAVYIFIGLRMGIGALQLWRKGYLKKELPRYKYQRRRWERDGKTNTHLAMQVDAIMQGLANTSYLALPAFIIASNPNPEFSIFELIGLILWILAFIMETVADGQKLKFVRKMAALGQKNKVCDMGLWKYSRHPNYFAEWMVWNALIIAAVPSWLALQSQEPLWLWIVLGLGLLFVSRIMYVTLVYATGAVPAEYYSKLKRPDYAAYQQRVNRFFPGPPKNS